MRDRLSNMIQSAVNGCAKYWADVIADKLIADGVIVPPVPVKVGQTMYKVWNGEILEVKVVKISYEPLPAFSYTIHFNSLGILCLMADGTINRKYSWDIYITREAAEKAIAERREG